MNGMPSESAMREMLARLAPRVIPARGGRRDLVRNAHGKPIPCCWQDCERPGSTRHEVRVPHDAPERRGDTLTYVFCTPAHKSLWLGANEPGNVGNHAASSSRLWTPGR